MAYECQIWYLVTRLCLQRNKNFFRSALKTFPLGISAKKVFPLLQLIFLLPIHLRFSWYDRKCLESGKNRKEIKWLLMAAPRIFRVSQASGRIELFQRFFFFSKDSAWTFTSGNLIDFFHRLGVASKNGPNIKKWVLKRKRQHSSWVDTRCKWALINFFYYQKLVHMKGFPEKWC